MKKYIIISIIMLSIFTALTFAIMHQKKSQAPMPQIISEKTEEKTLVISQEEKDFNISNTLSSNQEKISQYAKEFNIPKELEEEIIGASKEPVVGTKEPITEEELQQAGLSRSQIKTSAITDATQNLTAGYTISDESFNELLSLELDAETLGDLALLSLAEDKPYQAQKALDILKTKYPDSEVTGLVSLEYKYE